MTRSTRRPLWVLLLIVWVIGSCSPACVSSVKETVNRVTELTPTVVEEPGFLIWQDPKTQQEHYPRWHALDFPLIIMAHPEAVEWHAHIHAACDWWNVKLGFTAFLYLGEVNITPENFMNLRNVAMVVLAPIPAHDDPAFQEKIGRSTTGLLFDLGTDRISRALLSMTQLSSAITDSFIAARIARHELGHLLGLGHDPDPASLMYDTAILERYDVTPHDLTILRREYGHR